MSASTVAISGEELLSNMNLARSTRSDSWSSVIPGADDWDSEDESGKEKKHNGCVGPGEYKQGPVVTQDRNWENAKVVGKCSFNSDLFLYRDFSSKDISFKLTQNTKAYKHNFVLKKHQKILVGKKPYEGNPCGLALEKLYKLSKHNKYAK